MRDYENSARGELVEPCVPWASAVDSASPTFACGFAALGASWLILTATSKFPATTSAPGQDRENQRRCTFVPPRAAHRAIHLLWEYRCASNRKPRLLFYSSRSATLSGLGATDTN